MYILQRNRSQGYCDSLWANGEMGDRTLTPKPIFQRSGLFASVLSLMFSDLILQQTVTTSIRRATAQNLGSGEVFRVLVIKVGLRGTHILTCGSGQSWESKLALWVRTTTGDKASSWRHLTATDPRLLGPHPQLLATKPQDFKTCTI